MKRISQVLVLVVALVVFGCGGQDAGTSDQAGVVDSPKAAASESSESSAPSGDGVSGTIMGTQVAMTGSEFDGQLSIFEGDGWGWNPSLVIFLFLDDGVVPAGQTFSVQNTEDYDSPHVHYRWRPDGSDDVKNDSVMSKYEMELVFGQVEDNILPGTITFKIPGKDTDVTGSFRAELK